ncbi:STE3-domain-containing protein [Peniophora sp. CONT]|nr:STE3-domain-containing protein [Peniophora sp. CONT]
MGLVDPTYPLHPIACIIASFMLLLVLTTSFVRHSWNLGVTSLCFWLFLETLTEGVNAVIWSDNLDVKLYVYCDIVTHLQIITYVVKPMSTLVISRRLYLIASLESVELSSEKRWDLAVEWILSVIIPILIGGPIFYINQSARFFVFEGFGCAAAEEASILDLLIMGSWAVLPPLVSIIFYYPKVARTYHRQRKDIHSFLRSNPSTMCTNYVRILVLASIDILITLPIGIQYFLRWSSPVLAFIIFGLFGVTSEARTSYWRIVCTIGGWFGWRPTSRACNGRTSLGEIEFGPQDTWQFDVAVGRVSTSSLPISSSPDLLEQVGFAQLHRFKFAR